MCSADVLFEPIEKAVALAGPHCGTGTISVCVEQLSSTTWCEIRLDANGGGVRCLGETGAPPADLRLYVSPRQLEAWLRGEACGTLWAVGREELLSELTRRLRLAATDPTRGLWG